MRNLCIGFELPKFVSPKLGPACLIAAVAGLAASFAGAMQPGVAEFRDQTRPPPGQPATVRPEDPKRTVDYKAPEGSGTATDDRPDPEKPSYLVGVFVIRYAVEHPQFPALDDLVKAKVTLGIVDGGYAKPSSDIPSATYTIEELCTQPPQRYTTFALFAVQRAVKTALEGSGIFATLVSLSDQEFAPNDARVEGEAQYLDERPKGSTAVTLVIRTGVVGETRTLSFGDRIPYEERINNPRHEQIIKNSPVQVFELDDPRREDLLRKDRLDDYVFRLNRHPGRRVDLALAAGDKDGELALDYLVNESRPWTIYGQISNTGTKQTSEWRERFGFVNNQLTNADDILSIDYVTAGFEDSHYVGISYERPLWGEWLRGRLYGNANSFTASDVGDTSESFDGDGWAFGGEFIANVYQRHELFIDLFAGARWQHVKTSSQVTDTRGEEDFFLPDIGLRLARQTDTSSTNGEAGVEFNLPDVADTSEDLTSLQRNNADSDWATFHGELTHSMYLEQFFSGNTDAENPSTTLAHEVALSVRGQYAFGSRLIPNFQDVLGGLYTVRGYPESVVSGDSVVVASAEYRFHLPQALGIEATPGTLFGETFRYQPQVAYGRADRDLVLKGFLDVGRAEISGKTGTERDETLIGTGVGMDLLFRRNFNVRVDWGIALDEIDNEVTSGSNRFHISATISF